MRQHGVSSRGEQRDSGQHKILARIHWKIKRSYALVVIASKHPILQLCLKNLERSVPSSFDERSSFVAVLLNQLIALRT
jgi:hypothetical protein